MARAEASGGGGPREYEGGEELDEDGWTDGDEAIVRCFRGNKDFNLLEVLVGEGDGVT
jgi:hypothetical protein